MGFKFTMWAVIFSLNKFMRIFKMIFHIILSEKSCVTHRTFMICDSQMLIQMGRFFTDKASGRPPGAEKTFFEIIIVAVQVALKIDAAVESFPTVTTVTHVFYATAYTFSFVRIQMFLSGSKLRKLKSEFVFLYLNK